MTSNNKTPKVLLVEDLKVAQVAAYNILKQLGVSFEITTTAASALDRVLKANPNLIFVDIQLPDLNGFELTETIRSLERKDTRIPIVALTANFTEDLEERCRKSGIDDFLLKPITVESVRYILKKNFPKFSTDLYN
jgi:CheY-like chemotaxis protein